jgi:hypothetical protein
MVDLSLPQGQNVEPAMKAEKELNWSWIEIRECTSGVVIGNVASATFALFVGFVLAQKININFFHPIFFLIYVVGQKKKKKSTTNQPTSLHVKYNQSRCDPM